jgi:glycosyltransferase involved in cell wall biosynthesis
MGNSNAKGDAVLAELAELKVDLASHLKSLAQIQQRIDKLSAETSPKNDTRIAALIAAEIATISKAIGTSSSQASAEHAPLIINAKAAPVATVAKLTSGEKPLINWVIGPPDNAGWAYGNNARRLAREMPGYRHEISTSERAAVAVYFDAIVAERYTVPADKSILRIGGPRPLDRLFGDDEDKARAGLARFDAIVALSLNLFLRVSKVHPRTYFIPNALDLEEWRPERRVRPKGRPFTVGFAASLKSSKEIEVKGFEIARAGAEKAGVEFVYVEKKEGKQIAHDRMIEDFYSRCDVLAHPAAPGREGTSNVIMEALSCGVPVVTTVDAGLHGETLVDRRSGLIRPRSADAYAEAFTLLKNDRKMLQRISLAGRQYCERNHDIRQAASEYQAIIDSLTNGAPDVVAPPSTCFVPFWMPAQNFGSSRLRALYPFEFLVRGQYPSVSLGYNPDAQVAIIVQSCDEPIWESINKNKQQFVIYDVCDRYFENSKVFKRPTGDVNSLDRYNQLMERADLVIVPSRELKVEISSRHPHKPVIYVPETIDYGSTRLPVRPEGDRVVLWFGNPDRGNFESSMWMLQHVRDHYGYEPLIVSRASFFKKYPEFAPHVVNWSPEAMAAAFERANLCVLSHAQEERTKSPNRFISAIMRGIPTLVSGSPA